MNSSHQIKYRGKADSAYAMLGHNAGAIVIIKGKAKKCCSSH